MTEADDRGPRQLIILAAGRGTRLGAGLAKCLLVIAGETLLQRQIALARELYGSIRDITIVVGFQADAVRTVGGDELRYVVNDRFATTNTAASLALALERDPSPALLMNGDVLFDHHALGRLRDVPSGALCDFKPTTDPEEVQVLVDGRNRITRIGKDIGGVAEAVGVYRLSSPVIRAFLDAFEPAADQNRYYEDVLDREVTRGAIEFFATPLRRGRAIEIDTADDLGLARDAFEGAVGSEER